MKFLRSSPILGANMRKQAHFLVNSIYHWKIGLFGDENGTTRANDKYGSLYLILNVIGKVEINGKTSASIKLSKSKCQHNKLPTQRIACALPTFQEEEKRQRVVFEISFIFFFIIERNYVSVNYRSLIGTNLFVFVFSN